MKTNQSSRSLFIGIIIIICGVLVLFGQLDMLPEAVTDILISWQMLLIVIGVINLIFHKGRTGGYILIGIGAFFLLPEIITTEEGFFRTYWPFLLIFVGVLIIIKHLKPARMEEPKPPFQTENIESGYLDDFNLFGGGKKVLHGQVFKGGKSVSIFGGSEIDLRNTTLPDGPAELEILCLFGGSEIMVPPDWKIENKVMSILGGFSDSRKNIQTDNLFTSKILVIKGTVMFGGCEVKS